MNHRRPPYDITDRYGPRRHRGRGVLRNDYDERLLDSLGSPAFWASAAVVLALVVLAVRALH